jgi:hypothetical protein
VVPARRGRPRTQPDPHRRAEIRRHPNLPQGFLGEVGRWCRPGGGARGRQPDPHRRDEIRRQPQPPPGFLGGGGPVVPARRGRLADAAGSPPPSRDPSATPTSPRVLWGRWAGGAGPEGAPRGRSRIPIAEPRSVGNPNLPEGSLGGGGPVVPARRGRPRTQPDPRRRAGIRRQPRPPPGFLGEVGRWCRPGGGACGRQSDPSRRAAICRQPNLPPAVSGEGGRVVRARMGAASEPPDHTSARLRSPARPPILSPRRAGARLVTGGSPAPPAHPHRAPRAPLRRIRVAVRHACATWRLAYLPNVRRRGYRRSPGRYFRSSHTARGCPAAPADGPA